MSKKKQKQKQKNKKKTLKLFSIVLQKAFTWETDPWVTLGDFTVEMQNLEGKSVLNGSQLAKMNKSIPDMSLPWNL